MSKECIIFYEREEIRLSSKMYEDEIQELENRLAHECHSVESYLATLINDGCSDEDIQGKFQDFGLENLAGKYGLPWIRQIYFPMRAVEAESVLSRGMREHKYFGDDGHPVIDSGLS